MEKIKNNYFEYFNAYELSPLGWVKDQLETQLNGLSGHLCDFWPDISDSSWIGGKHDSWERTPYWLDGYIPLVYLLKDEKGMKKVDFYVKNIIKRQQNDGWIAPGNADRSKYDVWGIFIVLKALYEYMKVHKSSKVYQAIYNALKALNTHLDEYPLFDRGKYRWFEVLLVIYPLYKKCKEDWLIDLAKKLHDQGFDYYQYYLSSFPKGNRPQGERTLYTHGVNNAMAVKCYALYGRLTNDKADIKKSDYMLKMINKYHGNIMGTFNADECFAGLDPRRGSELCLIVELMYSLEELTRMSGKNKYYSQLERLAFNALPNALTRDMRAHQYDTQVNAPFIKRSDEYLWNSNGPESNIYGLEPHFGCCTSNFHQGWPKFVISSVAHRGKALFINSYIPLILNTRMYTLKIEGSYPFNKVIKVEVDSKVDTHINFNKPTYSSSVIINKERYFKNGYIKLPINKGLNVFEIEIDYAPVFIKNAGGYSLVDGSLVYGLKIDEKYVRINEDVPLRELPHGDFEIHNESKFNYALENLDIEKVDHDVDLNKSPFVRGTYPTSYLLNCVEIDYKEVGNYVIFKKDVLSKPIKKEFIPLGINKLHIGTLSLIKK